MAKSKLEDIMEVILQKHQLEYEREYRFHPVRRWRFDFYLPDHRTGIECEGGAFSMGRHNRAVGMSQDAEKYNQATLLDFKVLRFTSLDFRPANRQGIEDTILALVKKTA